MKIEFQEDALKDVAKQAIKLNTGARGLKSILEGVMLDLMYDVPMDDTIEKIIITKDAVERKQKPIIERKTA